MHDLTNHLPSPSLFYFSLLCLPLSALMLLYEKRQQGEKYEIDLFGSVFFAM